MRAASPPKIWVSWPAFIAFIGVWALATAIVADEELGIIHFLGLNPITWDALQDPRLFWVIFSAGPAFTAWWTIHVYRRKWGDLARKWAERYGK